MLLMGISGPTMLGRDSRTIMATSHHKKLGQKEIENIKIKKICIYKLFNTPSLHLACLVYVIKLYGS